MQKTLLSAVQPSNQLTLGVYLGAIKNWVQLQKDYNCVFFAVDLHCFTVRHDPKIFAEQTYNAIASYIAAGIDPDQALLFIQSHVPEHSELAWILSCYTYMGELNRMTQFKDKSNRNPKNINAGLFTYPVLMAADILLYDTHLVPVGADQKQHVELTREVATRLNHLYGEDTLVVPEPFIPPVGARIMSLQDPQNKMSKSDPQPKATVFLNDNDKTILKKIKSAITDSGSEIRAAEDKPGVSNLLNIQSAISGKSIAELEQAYQGKQYGHLKVETAEQVVECLSPIRSRIEELMRDRGELDRILHKGAQKAREKAQQTLDRLHQRLGTIPRA